MGPVDHVRGGPEVGQHPEARSPGFDAWVVVYFVGPVSLRQLRIGISLLEPSMADRSRHHRAASSSNRRDGAWHVGSASGIDAAQAK